MLPSVRSCTPCQATRSVLYRQHTIYMTITWRRKKPASTLASLWTKKMNWDQHVNSVVMKGKRTSGFLRRNLKQCTTPIKAATYTTVVRPAVEYASTVWDPYRQRHIKAVEQVQRRAARYVCNNYTDRTPGRVTGMIQDLQSDSLEDHRHTSRLQMLFKIKHGLVDVKKELYLKQSDSRTISFSRFFQERTASEVYYNSFFPRTIKDWNKLPPQVTSATSLEEFRAGLLVSPAHY